MSGAGPTLTGLIRDASRIMVFTGAGVSTSSGIPDFRGPTGVWKTHQPVMYADFMRSQDARVRYWEQKLETYREFTRAEPNATHHACVELLQAGKLEMLVTQNIDGLHEKAGLEPHKLVELHGTNARVQCQRCGAEADVAAAFAAFEKTRKAPCCATCDGPLKPATISFGQSLVTDDIARAEQAARGCDLVIALGSSLTVTPAATFPLLAAQRGTPYAIVNRGVTEHDGLREVTLRIEGDVIEIFPPAVAAALTGGG